MINKIIQLEDKTFIVRKRLKKADESIYSCERYMFIGNKPMTIGKGNENINEQTILNEAREISLDELKILSNVINLDLIKEIKELRSEVVIDEKEEAKIKEQQYSALVVENDKLRKEIKDLEKQYDELMEVYKEATKKTDADVKGDDLKKQVESKQE